ncbi:MAG: RNA methyltransferase [Geovibrio sp.]|uniref:RNA methyltransferase n=1 Tax=Geovibrio ferrireducens TaxID=46201 RepID=UPI002247B1A4|nr:RNA methyltransferase [Geovibrio ferrireducens]MCD8493250.1 RNA methyltransferase [Geovibrio sp.]
MSDPKERVTVLLSETEGAANLGYIARIMANTGFDRLKFSGSLSGREQAASRYAVHASRILDNAVKKASFGELTAEEDIIIGFSPRDPWGSTLPYSSLAETVKTEIAAGKTIGLLFGNEARGLSNEQLSACRYRVALPTEASCPSMNLSHAVLVVLWELRGSFLKEEITITGQSFASAEQKRVFRDKFADLLDVSGYLNGQNNRIRLQEISMLFDSKEWSEREMNLLTSVTGKLLREFKALKK